jgi:hypothetical protein
LPPSSIRVFAKSIHLLAVGWFLSISWIWAAGVAQHFRRRGHWPPNYGAQTFIEGTLSALVLEVTAILFVWWIGSAPDANLERREWHHAFWWAAFPNAMLLLTAYLMIQAGQ